MTLDTIKRSAPKNTRVLLYDGITRDRVAFFNGKDNVIVLYQIHNEAGRPSEGTGHYALVMRHPKTRKISYFSSYGYDPEYELHATHSKGKLLYILGKGYTWSRRPFQQKRSTSTCGLWCLCRAYLSKLKDKHFSSLIGGRLNTNTADDLVSIMTLILVADELYNNAQ